MQIISLEEARGSGLTYYFTGNPCKHGHISRRKVSNRTCVECLQERTKDWFARNPEYYRDYRSKNIESVQSKERAYYESNKTRILSNQKDYRSKNKDKDLARRHAAIARKKKAEGRFTANDVKKILESQDFKCRYCSSDLTQGYHVDHYMPLALGGSNWPENLQCLCQRCNSRKSAKHPTDFEKEIGFTK